MKFVPFTVSVKVGPPAVADEGLMFVIVGTGLVGTDVGCTTLTDKSSNPE